MEPRLLTPERAPDGLGARLLSVALHALVAAALVFAPWASLEPVEAPRKASPTQRVMLAPAPRPVRQPLRLPRIAPAQAALTLPAPGSMPTVAQPRLLALEPAIAMTPAVTLAIPETTFTAPKPMEPAPQPPKLPVAIATGTFEAAAPAPAATSRKVTMAGFDEAAAVAGRGRTVVTAAAGFGEAAAVAAGKAARTVASGGFETARAEAPRVTRAVTEEAGFAPVEILDKPQPVYTEEARRLRVEGSVQVRVVFGASGEIRVLNVVRSLGHGLDEAATAAAARIRFRPARKAGQPVDATAVVQIVFQLA